MPSAILRATALGDAFDGDLTVALRDLREMRAVVDAAPSGFGRRGSSRRRATTDDGPVRPTLSPRRHRDIAMEGWR
jgi:hypothetical protein